MRTHRSRGFTLAELLVVIGIIAVLGSMLLPTLNKVRAAANSAKCLANLRSIGQAMTMYASANQGFIPGSGNSSGRFLWSVSNTGTCTLNGYTVTNTPEVNDCLDWVGPLARVTGIKDPALDGVDCKARFRLYVGLPQFQCPSYVGAQATYNVNAGATIEGIQPAFSYNTALAFLNIPYKVYSNISFDGAVCVPAGPTYFVLPDGYVPKVTKVGSPSVKVYAADGARRTLMTGAQAYQPTYTLTPSIGGSGPTDTTWADYGPFFASTRSYCRDALPVNNSTTSRAVDIRALSMRHGSNKPFSTGGFLRMNLVFYDGHAENMDDMTAANPALWLPRGTVWTTMTTTDSTSGCKACYTDVYNKYMPGATTYIAP